MYTLGIETSCDETSVAVLENAHTLRANIIASSLAKHRAFGGIVPEIASRHTIESIGVVYREALRTARIKDRDIALISVTYGPGLIGSLLVGVSFAKSLSFARRIPLVGVNHLHAHIYSNFIGTTVPQRTFLGLVVSGGHTSVVKCNCLTFTELASTRDDACGEAFDKVAKILELGFPGGPLIEEKARHGDPTRLRFRCGQFKHSYDFSFSGIKTAVLYYTRRSRTWRQEVPHICAAFQHAVVTDIVTKTIALAVLKRVKHIVVGGGVSANKLLRYMLSEQAQKHNVRVFFPPFEQSLDNAAMVARCGYAMYKKGIRSDMTLAAMPNLGM